MLHFKYAIPDVHSLGRNTFETKLKLSKELKYKETFKPFDQSYNSLFESTNHN